MQTILVWKKIVARDVGSIRAFRGTWSLEPTWPHEKPYAIVTIPDSWKWTGSVFIPTPETGPIPLSKLVTRKVWS